jgi:hypothetical protein
MQKWLIFKMVFALKIPIFRCYVLLPEGTSTDQQQVKRHPVRHAMLLCHALKKASIPPALSGVITSERWPIVRGLFSDFFSGL